MHDPLPQPDEAGGLRFPFPAPPRYGCVQEVAEGILWARIPLPYKLDHVNIYFLRDGRGWAVIDTGALTAQALSNWDDLLTGPLAGAPITRIVVTHFHPDHIGLAGWLHERFGAPLLTSLSSFLSSRIIGLRQDESAIRRHVEFYVGHGMNEGAAAVLARQGEGYLERLSTLPFTFQRLLRDDHLQIGERLFRVLTGDGHAPEQVMLYCEHDRLLFAADQVLESVSPNVGVDPADPDGDPLGHFLSSLRFLSDAMPEDTLVLPGHFRPFRGLRHRCLELIEHHEERCDLLRRNCTDKALSAADLVPLLFQRVLDTHQMSFAFAETLAHVNLMIRRGEIRRIVADGRMLNIAT